jgi:hypothetical protein
MRDEHRFERPLFVLRNGKVVEDNVKEFLAWRKRVDPEAYRAAMRQLAEVVAEAAVRQLLAENAEQKPSHSLAVEEPSSGDGPERGHGDTRPAKIVPLTDIDAIRASGVLYPSTVDGWRWLYRQRVARGMTQVFLRVGRRIMIDLTAYEAALRKDNHVPRAAPRTLGQIGDTVTGTYP